MKTIAAISTAPGIGGIGIIRISGKDTFKIIEKIFIPQKKDKQIKGYSIKYGHIINPKTQEIIDEVLVSYFVGPKSYTTEDMCEINSHGGNIVMKKILQIAIENGATLAEPGEFTKKAFLNGRIDLSQAESIIEIINAKTEKEAKASVKQLQGDLSKNTNKISSELLNILVDIEALIDYPEYDIEEVSKERVENQLDNIKQELEKLEKSFETGKLIREGIKTVIIGKPNVGKSSLLNVILKEERAIVTEIEGTTRDTIEEFITIDNIPIKLIDTAGIRTTSDIIEQIGVKKSKELAQDSDLVIAILDGSRDLTQEDFEILDIIKNKTAIIVINKSELKQKIDIKQVEKYKKPIIKISALQKEGIEELYKQIIDLFNLEQINVEGENIITNIRHKELISNAKQNLIQAGETLNMGMPIDIIAINIKEAIENLDKITGKNVSEDIINEIFKKFCLGK